MDRSSGVLLVFDDDANEHAIGDKLAAALGWARGLVRRHAFPDGETRHERCPPDLPPRVALLRGLHDPNAKLTELLLAAAGARELGAARLALVCPYLAYMRQDMAFSPGEVVSQRHWVRCWPPPSTACSRSTRTCTAWRRWTCCPAGAALR
ncbi:MAG: ribose-phosphate pyrophosphokinase-like domain-containing protein [Rubrivivax sp.]